ncbi:MAG: caspase family protein [Epsilonproteobacteria bacterium]|nr:caspase family protein [Campylobacterota bacterium]
MGKRALLILGLLGNLLWAKDYALIIGISNYDHIESSERNPFKLEANESQQIHKEVELYKELLCQWGVCNKKDYIFVRENAIKKEILESLEYVKDNIGKDDRFYMFFTGHGMDAKNSHFSNNSSIKINGEFLSKALKNTGAIIPFVSKGTAIQDALIVGCRDIRPRLQAIDKKLSKGNGRGLIMFDACYSEKSNRDNTTQKRINVSENMFYCEEKRKEEPYPYKILAYISSSIYKAEIGNMSKGLEECLGRKNSKNKSLTIIGIKECVKKFPEIRSQRPTFSIKKGSENLSLFESK